ncbi:MAG: PfkB family carbohydrate kinase, partial [Planctomycetota bacterium]|nr:PfkB family carbohydrate kinase [Planctomycetota bacterium]
LGCDTQHLHRDVERMTPTYLKPRDHGDGRLQAEHERYDTKNRRPTSQRMQTKIIESLDELLPRLDAVVVLDQVEEPECGVVTTKVREALAQRAERYADVVFWVDSRRRINEFRGVIIKPNQFEAMGMENPPPGYEVDIDALCRTVEELRGKTGGDIFATLGTDGMLVCDGDITLVPTVRVDGPTDPTGAGDSATSGAVLALAAGAEAAEAALLGNLVASITVEQLATTGTAGPKQVADRLRVWHKQHVS